MFKFDVDVGVIEIRGHLRNTNLRMIKLHHAVVQVSATAVCLFTLLVWVANSAIRPELDVVARHARRVRCEHLIKVRSRRSAGPSDSRLVAPQGVLAISGSPVAIRSHASCVGVPHIIIVVLASRLVKHLVVPPAVIFGVAVRATAQDALACILEQMGFVLSSALVATVAWRDVHRLIDVPFMGRSVVVSTCLAGSLSLVTAEVTCQLLIHAVSKADMLVLRRSARAGHLSRILVFELA